MDGAPNVMGGVNAVLYRARLALLPERFLERMPDELCVSASLCRGDRAT